MGCSKICQCHQSFFMAVTMERIHVTCSPERIRFTGETETTSPFFESVKCQGCGRTRHHSSPPVEIGLFRLLCNLNPFEVVKAIELKWNEPFLIYIHQLLQTLPLHFHFQQEKQSQHQYQPISVSHSTVRTCISPCHCTAGNLNHKAPCICAFRWTHPYAKTWGSNANDLDSKSCKAASDPNDVNSDLSKKKCTQQPNRT